MQEKKYLHTKKSYVWSPKKNKTHDEIYRERHGRDFKKNYDEYKFRELDEVNEKVTEVLISKLSGLMGDLELVKDNVSLENDLSKNELFKRDVKRIIGYLTPYVPMVGLLSGGITVGAHVADKKFNGNSPVEKTQE